jgi:hypothetical protein
MLPFRVVVKPYLRPDLAAVHPHPNSFSIILIQPLSFLTFTHSSAQRTTPICFSFNHLHTLSTATEGVGGSPSSNPPTFPRAYDLSRLFSYHCALFCAFLRSRKTQPPCFQSSPHFCVKKHPGGGYPRFPRSTGSEATITLRTSHESPVTSHQSPLWPSAPLRRTAFGATIRKGTRNLYVPGKQLRSPRCLTILSGHREPFDDVPGYTPTQSGSQVVPGSSNLDGSRVARVTHPCRMAG